MSETFSFEDASKSLTLQAADRTRNATVLTPNDYGQVGIPDGPIAATDTNLNDMFTTSAKKYGVPKSVLMALAQQESGYKTDAVGQDTPYGKAKGIMQYLDSTAKKLGIDPFDPKQSIDAAAKQLSERMSKGLDWAVASHYAGDDPDQHGQNTKKYTASVLAKASAISKEIGDDFKLPIPAQDTPDTFSFEDAVNDSSSATVNVPGTNTTDPNQKPPYTLGALIGDVGRVTDIRDTAHNLGTAIKRGWEGLQDILSRDTQQVTLTEPELKAEWEAARKSDSHFMGAQTPDWETYKQISDLGGNKRTVSTQSYDDERLAWQQKIQDDPSQVDMLPARFKDLAPPPNDSPYAGNFASFMHSLKNPMALLTQDSLPANFVSWLSNQPELARKNYDEARKVAMQDEIVSNPDKYPDVSVQAAKKAIADRQAKQDPTIKNMWDNLKQAAKENPGKFAGDLANSLIADPELLAAPVGIGAKPVQAIQAARGITVASRAAKIADRILDSAGTAAVTNVAIGSVGNLAQTGSINPEEVKMNAALGAIVGGGVGTLGELFIKGAAAKAKDLQTAKTDGTYDQILKDRAAADVATENIIQGNTDGIPARSADTINQLLGITKSTDRTKLLEKRRKDVKAAFANDPDYADYLKYVADERMQRSQAMRQAEDDRQARVAAADEQQRLSDAQRRQKLQDDFDSAVAARNAGDFNSVHEEALNMNQAFDSARKLNNQEMLEALYTKDDPTIKQTEAKIARREAQLRRPKWQRGDIDPTLLARIGIAGTGAGLAYALSPDDYKVSNSVMAGLAGLLVPGAGRAGTTIISHMKQAGAIDPEGNIISMLVKQGKMANKLEAGDIMTRDNHLATLSAQGDQNAFKQLYDNYYADTRRYVSKFMRELNEKAGVDADDVTQEAFLKAYQNMDSYSKDAPFGAWIKRIARNHALDAIDQMKAEKRGSSYSITGDDIPGTQDHYSGDVGTSSNVYERGAGADLGDTPEGQMEAAQASDKLNRAFQKLSPELQDAVVKSQLENYTDVEIAELTHTPLGTVQRRIQRGKEALTQAIKDEYGNSDITDNGKKTIKLYHGTDRDFTTFNTDMAFLTKDAGYADAFSSSGNVLEFEGARGKVLYKAIKKDDSFRSTLVSIAQKAKADGYRYIQNTEDGEWISLYPSQDLRRIPRNQRGSIDPDVLKKMGMAAAGASIGWYLSDKNPVWGMGIGTVAGLLLSGKVGAAVVHAADYGLGITSTRVMEHSPQIHRAVVNMFRRTLEETHANFEKVDPFLIKLNKLHQDVQDVTHRAIMTGDLVVIKKWLDHLGDKDLIDGYKGVRSSLDSLRDKLEAQSRFKRKDLKEYFPRIVKDKEGLFQAIDKKEATSIADIIKDAEVDSMRSRGRGLNQSEESALINNILFEHKKSNQPGWSKNRAIEEITPELQKFYATPAESLHTYIRSAVEDLSKTEFFGKSKVDQVKGSQRFLDTERSINNLLANEIKNGMSDEHAHEIAKLLKSVLVKGDQAPAWIVQRAKNLASAGLIGNVWSATSQIGDVVMQTYLQDMRSTFDSVIRQATGKKFVDMKDYGLADSITAEFANQSKTASYMNKVFKYSLFTAVDEFGKNTALNAAISRAQRLASSPSGQLKLANKYAEAFGDDFPKLISELKSGKVSNLTREYAFLELSRSQPVTRFEMPQWWLDSPNVGRSALILKSFMLKQLDVARRDGISQIKQGEIAQGVLKLAHLGLVMGVAGTSSNVIQQVLSQGMDVLTGKKARDLQVGLEDVPLNIFRTFGINQYTKDHTFGVSKEEAAKRRADGNKNARTVKAEPEKTIPEMFLPPFKIFTDIATQNPQMYRYLIPGFGPYVAEQMQKADAEEKEAKKKQGGGTL